MSKPPLKFSAGSLGIKVYMDGYPYSIVINHAHSGDIEFHGVENLYDLQYIVSRAIQAIKESEK